MTAPANHSGNNLLSGQQSQLTNPTSPTNSSEHDESRENPTGLARILSRNRRTSSHSRSPNRTNSVDSSRTDTASTATNSSSLFSRMTGSTATPHEHASHGGPLAALKGVFSNRPSSRDRHSLHAEEGSERGSTVGGHDHERGRESKVSTGRGGAGNMRAESQSRARDGPDSGEDEARDRSRERSRDRGHGSGRGGAGNFRSASKNPEDRIKESRIEEEAAELERAAHEKRLAEDAKSAHSYGRGGAGNIK